MAKKSFSTAATSSRKGIYFGWWVVLASFVGLSLGSASMGVFGIGVFIRPLEAEFGWSRAQISFAAAIITSTIIVISPLQGYLLDRFGVRRVVLTSIPIFSVTLALLYFQGPDIRLFYLAWIVIMVFGTGFLNGSYNKVAAAWFDRRLGLAVGIVSAGQGAGAAIIPILSQFLIAHFGWRLAYVGLGSVALIVTFTVNLFLLYDRPTDKGLTGADGQELALSRTEATGFSVRQCLALRSFWLTAVAFFLLGTMSTGIAIHQVPMLIDRGLSPQRAADMQSLFGLALIVGRIGVGYLMDRIHAPFVAMASLLGPVIGLSVYALGAASGLAALCAVLIGFGIGAEFDVLGFIIARYFGRKAYGKLYGVLFSVFLFGGGLGAAGLGIVRTKVGTYSPGLWAVAAATLVALLLLGRLGPYTRFGKPGLKPA
jgi:MFS family permease